VLCRPLSAVARTNVVGLDEARGVGQGVHQCDDVDCVSSVAHELSRLPLDFLQVSIVFGCTARDLAEISN